MGKGEGPEHAVVVSATNRSEQTARVTSCGLLTQERLAHQWVALQPDAV